jgi:YVTN family beta-propeller protein
MATKSKTTGPYAYVSNSASSSVTVIDTSNPSNPTVVGSPIRVGSNPAGLVLTPKEDFLYVANSNSVSHSVSVIDTRNNKAVCKIDVGNKVGLFPTSMAISQDGTTIYAGLMYPDNENTFRMRDAVCAIDTKTNKVIAMIDISFGGMPVINQWPSSKGGCGGVGTLAMRPNVPELYVPIGYANKIAVIDTSSKCVTRTFPAGSGPGLAFDPNNSQQYYEVCTYNLNFAVFNASTDSYSSPTIAIEGTPEVVAVSPNSSRIYVLCVDPRKPTDTDRNVAVIVPGNPVSYIAIPMVPSALAFTQDSKYAYVVGGGDDAKLFVIRTDLNQVIDSISLPEGGADGIVIGKQTY